MLKHFCQLKHKPISSHATTEQIAEHLKRAKERAASSYSGLYFEHCKAHSLMLEIVETTCKVENLAIKECLPLLRWVNGVSMILEKATDNVNVHKLRDIPLLEADFNAMHKIIFSNRLIPELEAADDIPPEAVGGRRSQAATHLPLK